MISVLCILYYIPFCELYKSKQAISTGIVQDGKWANNASYPIGHESIKMKYQYSYDIFSLLQKADIINSESEINKYNKLIIITPTKPFSNTYLSNLHSWVLSGGVLLIVADHTNLFGHQTVLSPLLDKFKVKIEPDALFEDKTNGGTYENLLVKFSGLTPCSISYGVIPRLWMRGYSEHPNYQSPSFFGNLSISNDDNAGFFTVLGSKRVGFGEITVFSDSTFLSNFAINRWSTKVLLNCLNWPLQSTIMAYSALVIVLISFYFSGNIFIIISYVLLILSPSLGFKPFINPKDNVFMKPPYGPSLSLSEERDQGIGSSILASAYAFNISINYNSNNQVTFSEKFNKGIPLSNATPIKNQDWSKIPPFNYADIQRGDFYSDTNSFWFGQGVGDIRGANMANFWRTCGAPIASPLYPNILSEKYVSIFLESGEIRKHGIVELSDNWIIIDNRLIGKFVDGSDKILLRREWQFGPWLKNDLVIRFKK